jgi:hypothetical protein
MSNDEIKTSERAISFEQTQPKQRKTSLKKDKNALSCQSIDSNNKHKC